MEDRERWYAGDFVAGVIDDNTDVQFALNDLDSIGFSKEAILVFSGERGAEEIGHIGGTGLVGQLRRAAADYVGNAREVTERHKEEAARGHHVMMVPIDGLEPATRVRHMLQAHGGHDIHERIGGSFQTELNEPD
jgi:hypothetical protein